MKATTAALLSLSVLGFGSVRADITITPTNARTADEFDSLLRNQPENSVITIQAGQYQTRGSGWDLVGNQVPAKGFFLKRGWKIRGAGMDITRIRLVDLPVFPPSSSTPGGFTVYTGWNRIMAGTYHDGSVDNVEVSNLTLDGNAPTLLATPIYNPYTQVNQVFPYSSIEGLVIAGTGTSVNNVHVTLFTGQRIYRQVPFADGHKGDEMFGIWAGSSTKGASVQVTGCFVSYFYNPDSAGLGECTGIHLGGDATKGGVSGTVRDCKVQLNCYLNGGRGEFAYGTAGPAGVSFTQNKAYGGNRGFNHDSYEGSGITVSGNTFMQYSADPSNGVFLYCRSANINVSGNTFYLYRNGSSAINLNTAHQHGPWTFSNNTIFSVAPYAYRSTFGFNAIDYSKPGFSVSGPLFNCSFSGNRIHSDLWNFQFSGALPGSYCSFFDNKAINSSGTLVNLPNPAPGFPQ